MEPDAHDPAALASVRRAAIPLDDGPEDVRRLAERVHDARLVLVGGASHGTDDFHRLRAGLTRHLIETHRISAVALEADWPDAWRINRYVRGQDGRDPLEALAGCTRFPAWIWRNEVVLEFIAWLREWNDERTPERRVGVYGLDRFSLYTSIRAVLDCLERVDPAAAQRARYRYACFEHFGEDSAADGYAAAFRLTSTCERDVVHALVELQRSAAAHAQRDDDETAEEIFHAGQNARLVTNAEEYYRSMFQGRGSSWNLREQHMMETLQALITHLGNQGIAPHIAVWGHNSHVGDARATEMGWQGELNVGQLVRQRFGRGAVLIGLTTHGGTVTAADGWDRPAETRDVVPALSSSFEALFHAAGTPRFLLDLRAEGLDTLREPRLERAIGVVYRADTERLSHYFKATLKDQFDLVVHIDQTKALVPLERAQPAAPPDVPETFPSGV